MQSTRRWPAVAASALTVLLLVGGWWWYRTQARDQGTTGGGDEPAPVTVAAALSRYQDWQPQLSAVGVLESVQGVAITSEVAGQVRRIAFQSGTQVEQGALLVELRNDAEKALVAELEAAVTEADAELRRDRRLFRGNAISDEQFETSTSRVDQLRARLDGARAQLEKKIIRAPFAGTLGIRQIDIGQYLSPGMAVVTLQQLAPIHVDFSLPEHWLAQIDTGQQLEVRTDVWPERVFTGEITSLEARADPETHTVQVQGTLENAERHLRPGLFADVTVLLPARRRLVVVPETAISYAPYGNSVYVVVDSPPPRQDRDATDRPQAMAGGAMNGAIEPQGCAAQRRDSPTRYVRQVLVHTGERRGDWIEIREGLDPNRCVVTAGQLKLRSGAAVKLGEGLSDAQWLDDEDSSSRQSSHARGGDARRVGRSAS